MRRSEKEFSDINQLAVKAWARVPTTCHHRSTITTCPDIAKDKELLRDFRKILAFEWLVTRDNFAAVANTTKEIGRALVYTREYFDLLDPTEPYDQTPKI